jgi:PAS domain S-box-containing protein
VSDDLRRTGSQFVYARKPGSGPFDDLNHCFIRFENPWWFEHMTNSGPTSTDCFGCKDGLVAPFRFSMAFQPIVDVEAQRVYAYEALVRGPANETAYSVLSKITKTNRYAFDQACRVKAIALAGKLEVVKTSAKLCINFMPGAVYSPSACIRRTLEAARQASFPLDRLVFEITEAEEVKDRAHLRTIFEEYRRHGFKMAMDDFGSGFCGLNLFADLTPDILKLDRGLVCNLPQRAVAMATMRALVQLCETLGVVLIAEGVETTEEFYALQSCGVRFMQGFLFAQPAFEALPDFSLPNTDTGAVEKVEPVNRMSTAIKVQDPRSNIGQVPRSFVLPGHLDFACLDRLTQLAAKNLLADGAFLVLNAEGILAVACSVGSVDTAELTTLQFMVDSGPARGPGLVISHSVADRSLLATISLHKRGQFLGIFGVCRRSTSSVSAAQECILQTLALEVTEELEREALSGASLLVRSTPYAPSSVDPFTQQLQLLESVVVHAKDSVLITDAEPIDNSGPVIRYANPAFSEPTGYSMEEVLGKTPRILQGRLSGREPRDRIREALSQWKSIEVEILNYRKDGTQFWVELSISPVSNLEGRYTHWVSVQRDITQRKEREAFESDRMQSALLSSEAYAAKGRLAATTAHEINNPLEAVMNLIYIARTTQGVPPEVAEVLELADVELARVGVIAQQTLGFYRDTSLAGLVDITALIETTALLYASLLHSKQIRLEQQLTSGLSAFGKTADLKQIFSNLLMNAIDATPKGGRIILRAHPGTDGITGDMGVRATVADSGEGMSSEVLTNAFSVFFTTKGSVGTGLGLWVTKSLLEKNGGSIRCRSRQGTQSGTSMSVFLPLERKAG